MLPCPLSSVLQGTTLEIQHIITREFWKSQVSEADNCRVFRILFCVVWSLDNTDSVHSIDSSLTNKIRVNHGVFSKAFVAGCSMRQLLLRPTLTGVPSLFLAVVSSSRRLVCSQRGNFSGPKDPTGIFSIKLDYHFKSTSPIRYLNACLPELLLSSWKYTLQWPPVMTFLGRSELVLPKQTAEVQWRRVVWESPISLTSGQLSTYADKSNHRTGFMSSGTVIESQKYLPSRPKEVMLVASGLCPMGQPTQLSAQSSIL